MITAFATEYMQEGHDGCSISLTYLNLIACFRYIESLDPSPADDDNDSLGNNPNGKLDLGSIAINQSIRSTSVSVIGLG